MSLEPFRLLDLPQEIQNQIFTKYYEGVELILQRIERRDTILFSQLIKFHPLPSLALELTSRKVFADSRKVRQVAWPRKLTLVNLLGIKFWILQLAEHSKYKWLRNHIESFEFNGREYVWLEDAGIKELVLGCPSLREIRFVVEVNKFFVEDGSMMEYPKTVEDRKEHACQPAGRGFVDIGRFLQEIQGSDAVLAVTQTVHCRLRNEVRHALDPNGDSDTLACVSNSIESDSTSILIDFVQKIVYKFSANKQILEVESADIVVKP